MKPSILIIDDEDKIRKFLRMPFEKRGYVVSTAATGKEGMELYRKEAPDIMILDMRLPDSNGMDILENIMAADPDRIVIMITAFGEIRLAVKAMKLGAYDYVTKPFEFEEINLLVEKAAGLIRIRNELDLFRRLRHEYMYEDMVGKCKKIQAVFSQIEEVAKSPATTVYISGETGVGKELVARAIHRKSSLSAGPFVAINCTVLDEKLLQSELFGHEKGAFTDAKELKKGLFEVADGGTIFLDEIGDMNLILQAKLLRVLEEMSFRRVGGIKDISVDLRVIASSNKDLKKEMSEGRFRSDLYYRVNVVSLNIPPLRERGDDILLLADYFLGRYNKEFGKEIKGFSPEAASLLVNYIWPGNVRELKNTIERLVLLTRTAEFLPAHLPPEILGWEKEIALPESDYLGVEFNQAKKEVVDGFEKKYLTDFLKHYKGNVSQSARAAGINRSSFQRLIKKSGLTSRQFVN